MSLEGKIVVFTGTLDMKRAEAKAKAEAAGAKVTAAVSAKTNILVCGADAGSKLAEAEAKGIEVWTEKEFVNAVTGKRKGGPDKKKEPAAKKGKAPAKAKGKASGKAKADEKEIESESDDSDGKTVKKPEPAAKKAKAPAKAKGKAAATKEKEPLSSPEPEPKKAPAKAKGRAKAVATREEKSESKAPAKAKGRAKAAKPEPEVKPEIEAKPETTPAETEKDEKDPRAIKGGAAALGKAKSTLSDRASAPAGAIEVVLSFDTTGSMYPVLGQVQQSLVALVGQLFKEFPHIRIGVIAHGDYCDAGSTYVIKTLPFSNDVGKITSWMESAGRTGGGDFPECYELALKTARTSFSWTDGARKSLVLIGDAPPHEPGEAQNKDKINWRTEAEQLGEAGVIIYAIQALRYKQSNHFYDEIARLSGGVKLSLDQFSESPDFVRAICYREVSTEHLQRFEDEVRAGGRMTRAMGMMFDSLAGRAPKKAEDREGLKAVEPGRFQVLRVPSDMPIKDFCQKHGLEFKPGRGFYEFTKSETIQDYKEIVLRDKTTGDMFTGAVAREMLGLPASGNAKIKPADLTTYNVFVQSTSNNRKLIGGTGFLFEVTRED